VILDVEGLTLEGPNAGTGGDSTERGDEAAIERGVRVVADGVTLDGLRVENNDTNGVRLGPDTVPDDTTVRNSVIAGVEGGTSLRGGADAGAGNGIQVQFSDGPPAGETAENLRILDNRISNISTPDVSPGGDWTTAIGINVLPRGNDVDIEIDGNTITGIEPGASGSGNERARGVSIDTQVNTTTDTGRVDGATITNNEITGLTSSDRYRAIALFEDASLTPAEGPRNFTVKRNNFEDFEASGIIQASIFVGGYETLGEGHVVTENNIDEGFVERFTGGAKGFEALDAVENWWGDETGPSGDAFGVEEATGDGINVSENVTFKPFLESPFTEDEDEPTETVPRQGLSRSDLADRPTTEQETRRSTGRGQRDDEASRGSRGLRRSRGRGSGRSR